MGKSFYPADICAVEGQDFRNNLLGVQLLLWKHLSLDFSLTMKCTQEMLLVRYLQPVWTREVINCWAAHTSALCELRAPSHPPKWSLSCGFTENPAFSTSQRGKSPQSPSAWAFQAGPVLLCGSGSCPALCCVWDDAELPLAGAAVCLGHCTGESLAFSGLQRQFQQCSCVSSREGNPKAAEVSLPAWGGGFGFVLLLLLTTSDGADFPEAQDETTAKEASKGMGVFWSTLERVCFLSPLAQWHTDLDDWAVTEPGGKCQWKNAEKRANIFTNGSDNIFYLWSIQTNRNIFSGQNVRNSS